MDKDDYTIFNPAFVSYHNKSIVKTQLVGNKLTLTVDAGAYEEIEMMAKRYQISSENMKCLEECYRNIQEDVKLQNAIKMAEYERDLLRYRSLSAEGRDDVQKPKKPASKDIKPVFNFFLASEGETRAFIKSYFLYEFLLEELKMSGLFCDEDFQRSLKGCSSETISCKRGSVKARNIFGLAESVLYVDTLKHSKSAKKSSSAKQRYEYVFHPISFQKDFAKYPIELHYQLTDNLSKIVQIHYEFYKNPDKKLSIQDIIELYQQHSKGKHDKVPLHAWARTTLLNPCNELNFSDECENGEDGWSQEQDFGFEIFKPKYSELELSAIPQKDLVGNVNIEELKKWVRYCMDDARITTVSRLWHPFHCLPKSYREHVTYNGSPLVEAMDVKNCYYVLMVKALQLADKIDPDELRRFEALVRDGDIYMEIGNDIQFIHEIKEDYNDDDYLSFIGTTRRDRVKVEMQSFRNYKTYGQAESQHPMLAKKFKELFPSICHWLFTYPIYRNRKGKNAKRLQADMSRIETMLISKVCFRLKDMGLTPFTLHDAIYLSREELDIVGKGFVDKLFWEVFDATTEEDVRRALEYRYNKEEGKV